jgi:hypothetical protein
MRTKVRATLLSLTLLTLLAAIAALTIVSTSGSAASAATAKSTMAMPVTSTGKIVAFHQAMDKLWEDHVTWTRLVIVSFAGGLPDLNAAEARLLRNQVDIGNAIKPFYGKAAGNKLTSLLRTHILQAVTVLQAAKAGNTTELNAALKAWHVNAHQIAAFLSKANPKNWPLAATTKMMDKHLNLTTQEAVDRLKGNWTADVRDYDAVHNEILMMSNTLASGIISQFPQRFK